MRLLDMARAAYVACVTADFAFNLRIAYRITLSCGCRYWEHRPMGMAPPRKGRPETCHAAHRDPAPPAFLGHMPSGRQMKSPGT